MEYLPLFIAAFIGFAIGVLLPSPLQRKIKDGAEHLRDEVKEETAKVVKKKPAKKKAKK